MISEFKFILASWILLLYSGAVYSQQLEVTLDDNAKSIDRNTSNGVSTVVFDSKVKGLEISVNGAYEVITPKKNLFLYRIDTKNDSSDVLYQSDDMENVSMSTHRIFSLRSPKSAIYSLPIDIFPNTMYYYTVILPEQYAKNLTAEYLFTKSSMHGIRISYGKRFGFYLSYKWGEYKRAGTNIREVTKDYDVTKAKELGYIRTAITCGLRLGVLHTNKLSLYTLLGGGYGEYGRQWKNPREIENNIYFYSDYIKGFNGDLVCQAIICDWLCLSLGADALIGNGTLSLDYQMGLGVNLNFDKLLKCKSKF